MDGLGARARKGVITLLFLPLAAAGASAVQDQEPVDEGFGEELAVTEVLLDVVVTDRDDRIIVGLGREDFVVAERREVMDLSSVTFYSSRTLLESAKSVAPEDGAVDVVPQSRFFVLYLQEQRFDSVSRPSPVLRQREAGREVARWLVEDLEPVDRMAVVSYGGRLKVQQDFTNDRETLLRAVEAAARGEDLGKLPPSRQPLVESDPAALASLPKGKTLRRSTPNEYRALQLVAGALKDVPGRKNLIYIGRGFGEIGTYGNYQPQLTRFNPTVEALNDSNVAVYAIDVTGPGVPHTFQISMRDLASATGGRFFYDNARFTKPLDEIANLTSGYYLLSYRSRHPVGESGYQRVRVGTRNPEFRIQARQGYYYGPSD